MQKNSSNDTSLHWQDSNKELFFSRNDPRDLRWGDLCTQGSPLDFNDSNHFSPFGLWGYTDDQGIALNGGRVGAALAPNSIRKQFYKITPHNHNIIKSHFISKDSQEIIPHSDKNNIQKSGQNPILTDYGNWLPFPSLNDSLKKIPPLLAKALQHQKFMTLGGGHDFAAVDGSGFIQWCQSKLLTSKLTQSSPHSASKPLILNFDAHLDVRPWQKGLNSGTPFSWLLDHFPNQFEFIEIGIQAQCSSLEHHQWLRDRNVSILDCDLIHKVGLLPLIQERLAGTSVLQDCYVSVDIDVFSQDIAPGCSQSWVGGLQYTELNSTLQWLYKNKNVALLGIYEVSPPLDIDQRTTKLAAMIMNEFLNASSEAKYLF